MSHLNRSTVPFGECESDSWRIDRHGRCSRRSHRKLSLLKLCVCMCVIWLRLCFAIFWRKIVYASSFLHTSADGVWYVFGVSLDRVVVCVSKIDVAHQMRQHQLLSLHHDTGTVLRAKHHAIGDDDDGSGGSDDDDFVVVLQVYRMFDIRTLSTLARKRERDNLCIFFYFCLPNEFA